MNQSLDEEWKACDECLDLTWCPFLCCYECRVCCLAYSEGDLSEKQKAVVYAGKDELS